MDKGSLHRGRGVCTEIHEAELWRFMELPACGAGKHGASVARYSLRAKYTGL